MIMPFFDRISIIFEGASGYLELIIPLKSMLKLEQS